MEEKLILSFPFSLLIIIFLHMSVVYSQQAFFFFFFLAIYCQIEKRKKIDFGGFSFTKVREKKTKNHHMNSYMWFSLCGQTHRRLIKDFSIIFGLEPNFAMIDTFSTFSNE